MAFKSFSQYSEEKNGNYFTLPNDGDYADVVFLYTNPDDVLIGDFHYIKSATYSGYVHCLGRGCPGCSYGERGLRVDTLTFIPVYVIDKNQIEFWSRTPRFVQQVLQPSVFKSYPNPSECVFRITRHGEAGDMNTRYKIDVMGRNTAYPYSKIMADFGLKFPESYDQVCKEVSAAEMSQMLNTSGDGAPLTDYTYVPVPRGQSSEPAADLSSLPEINVPTPVYNESPADLPPVEAATSSTDTPAESSDDSIDNVDF